MKMSACWFVSVMTVAVLTSAVVGDQNDMMRALLSRMDAIEGRVASLENRLTGINSGESPVVEGKEPKEFKVVNLTQSHDREAATVTYTLHYEAEDQIQILMAHSEWTIPTQLSMNEPGPVHFSVPDTEVSPVVYVRTSSNLIYTLILVQASGPPRESPEDIPNVILTTTPEHSLPFDENEEPEITVLSHVTGNREVRKEALVYYAYVLEDFIVDFVQLSQLYEDDLETPRAENDDVNGDVNAGNDDGRSTPQRLHLLDHSRNGRDTSDRVRLDTSYENSGVLFVQKRFEFRCQSCVLYEMRVTKPMPYYLDDGLYTLPEGALVAYKDLYNFGPDFKGPRYFRFVRYNQSEGAQRFDKTCYEGHPCQLLCEAFGDNPYVHFSLFGSTLREQPTYYDQSGTLLDPSQSANAKISGWSVRFGYAAMSVIKFDDVRRDHAGAYNCFAEIASGLMMRRVYVLTVQ